MNRHFFTKVTEQHNGTNPLIFDQKEILSLYSGFSAKKIGSAESVSVSSNTDITRGVCFGLNMLLMEKKFDFSNFTSDITSAEGIGKIRGYMHMQTLGGTTKLGKGYYSGDDTRRTLNEGHISLFSSSSDLSKLILQKEMVFCEEIRNSGKFISSAGTFQKYNNHYFEIGTFGTSSHAQCAIKSKDFFLFFDPNLGVAVFPIKSIRDSAKICKFMDAYLRLVYQGALSDRHTISIFKNIDDTPVSYTI
ncbi:hypothetical protein [Pelagibaculum spongiae]|uniref:Peptidase C58 YopT-type domain-containing protein n=1 Tax=Pelagibaculum spongiae TaxID=2080658 RepID=A0A2V1GU49_9GAMM|nr:hypothetical protein [Pelagibaculum spongiae]PVZ65708.1 hypothetical protein DC094_17665 [Pelagibaculum spongiae]